MDVYMYVCMYVCVYIYIYRERERERERAPSKAKNLTSCIYGRDFLLWILLLEPCISLIYAWKNNKHTNYSFSLLIMYDSSYMFRQHNAIFRDQS
jgi:hypothetical protein